MSPARPSEMDEPVFEVVTSRSIELRRKVRAPNAQEAKRRALLMSKYHSVRLYGDEKLEFVLSTERKAPGLSPPQYTGKRGRPRLSPKPEPEPVPLPPPEPPPLPPLVFDAERREQILKLVRSRPKIP